MEKIVFENTPSTKTPLNATNLNLLQENVEKAITENSDKLDDIGIVYTETIDAISCGANISTDLAPLTLPKGIYVITSKFIYEGADLRYFHTLGSSQISAYDNAGNVSSTVTNIAVLTAEKTIVPTIWPSKEVTVNAKTTAVKIK